jgi:ERCC4-type nuclease
MKIIIDEREHELYSKCLSIINENSLKYKNIILSKKVLQLGDILIKTDDKINSINKFGEGTVEGKHEFIETKCREIDAGIINVNLSSQATANSFSSTLRYDEKMDISEVKRKKNKLKESNIPLNKDIILIERKTFSDLLASIRDWRYNEQSHRLLYSSELPSHNVIYLLEGMFSQTKENDRKTIMSAITTLNYFKGFSVMRTANVKESAEWLICTADKIQRELNKSGVGIHSFGGVEAEAKPEFIKTKCNEIAITDKENLIELVEEHSNTSFIFSSERSVNKKDFAVACEEKIAVSVEAPPNQNVILSEQSLDERQPLLVHENKFIIEKKEPPEYCTVVKKEKCKNITPENIGAIFLCQIPLVHSVSAVAIMQKFSSFQELINSLVNNQDCLNDIYTETNGKKRKLSKAIIQNIKKYLGIL